MKILVTGGGGFVGKALCLKLVEQGHQVFSLSRSLYPELQQAGVTCLQADLLTDLTFLDEDLQGTDAVFHVAAKVDMWGRYGDFYKTNILGTRNIIKLCKRLSIKRLIFTSSPSVIADGKNLAGINEGYPYPRRYTANYPHTKARAEQEVCDANSDTLWTVALRPHLIWGPGDTNLVPTILGRAKAGRLVKVGRGENRTDVTYIADCVQAHICALGALADNPNCRGKAYFISQGEPVNMWQWIDDILRRHQLPPVKRQISKPVAMGVAHVCEAFAKVNPSRNEPLLTRFLVSEMATSHYFDISAARQDLGFEPQYSVAQAMDEAFGAVKDVRL